MKKDPKKGKTRSDPVSDYLAEIGRRGGAAKVPKGAALLSPAERRERAKKMAAARWSKKDVKKKSAGSPRQ